MKKFLKFVGSVFMILGWLGSITGISLAKSTPPEKKEPPRNKVDAGTPLYLRHGQIDAGYRMSMLEDGSPGGNSSVLHWNHWSHGNHSSHCNHYSHHSHWNSW